MCSINSATKPGVGLWSHPPRSFPIGRLLHALPKPSLCQKDISSISPDLEPIPTRTSTAALAKTLSGFSWSNSLAPIFKAASLAAISPGCIVTPIGHIAHAWLSMTESTLNATSRNRPAFSEVTLDNTRVRISALRNSFRLFIVGMSPLLFLPVHNLDASANLP